MEWKDGSTSWELLSALKETNPVEVADYAVVHQLMSEPAFAWWVPYKLKKRMRIVAAVNSCFSLNSHKFGVQLPRSCQEALAIDAATNTSYWKDSINLEIKKVDVAFQDLEENKIVPVGYQFVKCHMIFDVRSVA
jgi:hypothetical protein